MMKLKREMIIRRALPRARYLGFVDTKDGVLHFLQLGKLIIGGTPTNSTFLVENFVVMESWENPILTYVEEFDVELF